MGRNRGFLQCWSCAQVRAILGLAVLASMSTLITSELPTSSAIPLAIGQFAGWTLAIVSALRCCFTLHSEFGLISMRNTVCEKCQMQTIAGASHCDICEVCVPAYSHHSDWLNSCIGAGNCFTYLGCLLGLGFSALCQLAAGVSLLVLSAIDKDLALRINTRYSLRDQGYLFHLLHHFSALISAVLAFSSFLGVCRHCPKAFALWKQRREVRVLPFFRSKEEKRQEKWAKASTVSWQVQSDSSNVRCGETVKVGSDQEVV